ncbi:hypothetical protein M3Y94_00245000 [Aphelenchoides besseyi]|nr:hypothetical protein M3Y94_00245000 [Aphelenchoides besseyi]KAI6236309.1 hypothetical protein M3Y95_00143700 [Aphelenchoides besseyi]
MISSLRLFVLIMILLTQKQTESGWLKKDPSYKLWCYEGSRLMIGHDAREDSSECKSIFGVKQYCYRFVAHSPVHDMVKLGCASLMCSPIRNTCAEFEMGGIAGTLCCCNDQSYCNSAPSKPLQWSFFTTFIFFVLPKLCN